MYMYKLYATMLVILNVYLHIAYQEVDLFTEIRGKSDNKTNFDVVFSSPSQPNQSGGDNWGGGILQPQAVGPLASQELLQPTKPTTGLAEDVESSLAVAAANLSMWPPNSANSHTQNTVNYDLWGNLV